MRAIIGWAIGLGVLAVLSLMTLWWLLGNGSPQAQVQLNIIRTAFGIVVGGGGAAGLLLTARRQRATELDIKQKDHDATETRVTELYGKAADQLGSDKAPVRLAGIFALERLADSHPEHRQTIVDLICAYLRMPFDQPDVNDMDNWAQELEVRQTAQGVLAAHLQAQDSEGNPAASYWPGLKLSLSGATLNTFTFTRCVVRSATFANARFLGAAVFRGTVFEQHADFRNVRFTGLADFRRVTFGGEGVTFRGATFEGEVDFGNHTTAALTGATTWTDGEHRRKWPSGWTEDPSPDQPGWSRLVQSKPGEPFPDGARIR
jgi:hypothetical protein